MLRCDDFVYRQQAPNPLARTAIDRSIDRARVHSLIRRVLSRREAQLSLSLSLLRSVFHASTISFKKRAFQASSSLESKISPVSIIIHTPPESLSRVDGKEDRSIIRGLIDELRGTEKRETILWGRSTSSGESRRRNVCSRRNFDQLFD